MTQFLSRGIVAKDSTLVNLHTSLYARQSFLISRFLVLFFQDYLYKSSTNLFQASGDTVLHAAVRKKDVDIAKLLVEFGCPVDVQNVTTETVLSWVFVFSQ